MTGARSYSFELLGDPMSWARPGQNGKIRFTLEDRSKHMSSIRKAAMAAGVKPIEGPVHLEVVAVFTTPRKWAPATRTARVGSWATENDKDVDNLAKLVMDALQAGRRQRIGKYTVDGAPAVAYADDKQVVDLRSRAIFGVDARTIISVRPANGFDLPDAASAERAKLEPVG